MPFRVILVVAVLATALLLSGQALRADNSSSASAQPAAAPSTAPTPEKQRQFADLAKQLPTLTKDKKYEEALAVTRKMIDLGIGLPECYYNLACYSAQLGQTEEAFTNLKKAADLGYADAEQMKTDADLDRLRKDPRFASLLATVARAALKPQEKSRQYAQLFNQLASLIQEKKSAQAEAVCRKMLDLNVRPWDCNFYLAVCQAQSGQTDEAFASLEKAVKLGWPDIAVMKNSPTLDSLRQDPRFAPLVDKVAENADTGAAFPYDKGTDLPGLKKVENVVKDGLRYRLWMNPKATKEKPDRLIVWLHPSGGLNNNLVEKMAPMFSKHGFALLVFTQKDPAAWTIPDLIRTTVTMKAVGQIEGLDLSQPLPPVLLGFSDGGQAAMWLWRQNAQPGGLILDAAYPIDTASGRAIAPNPSEAAKTTPFFVLVGADDQNAASWRQVQDAWLNAGVPLVIHYVPKAKNQWLFDAAETTELEKWLTDVTAGKKPAGLPAVLERPADSGKP